MEERLIRQLEGMLSAPMDEGFTIDKGHAAPSYQRCPRCNSAGVLPIVYGMPTPETVEKSAAGRVALGGCVLWPEAPDSHCVRCGHEWRVAEAGL